jgi:hypothetical protein
MIELEGDLRAVRRPVGVHGVTGEVGKPRSPGSLGPKREQLEVPLGLLRVRDPPVRPGVVAPESVIVTPVRTTSPEPTNAVATICGSLLMFAPLGDGVARFADTASVVTTLSSRPACSKCLRECPRRLGQASSCVRGQLPARVGAGPGDQRARGEAERTDRGAGAELDPGVRAVLMCSSGSGTCAAGLRRSGRLRRRYSERSGPAGALGSIGNMLALKRSNVRWLVRPYGDERCSWAANSRA